MTPSGNGGPPDPDPSETLYRFLPSARHGLRPEQKFGDGGPGGSRGVVPVHLDVKASEPGGTEDGVDVSQTVGATKEVLLYGPGDVIGVDHRQVIRVHPKAGTPDHPPNLFAHVEFDRPDLPWLFSPERANPAENWKARPWFTLVVVEKQDGVTLKPPGRGPLPVLEFGGGAFDVAEDLPRELPPVDELWAWAHVQVVGEATPDGDGIPHGLDRGEVQTALRRRSDRTLSRLVAPRRLEANRSYLACVVPAFEAGRIAGLGKDIAEDAAGRDPLLPAWAPSDGEIPTPFRLPVYFHWEFDTGPRGDFESLVRALEPRRLDDFGVGARPVDVSDPGVDGVSHGRYAPDGDPGPLKLGGALRPTSWTTGARRAWGEDLTASERDDKDVKANMRKLLNRAERIVDSEDSDAPDVDAAVGPPIYGQWHADVDRLPTDPSAPWLDDLNLDPLHRVAAGFGTRVVQDLQEALMAAAWDQYGDLKQANRLVHAAQLARAVGEANIEKLQDVPAFELLSFTAPMHRQIQWRPDRPMTVRGWVTQTALPPLAVRPAFRRLLRPRGPLLRRVETPIRPGAALENLAGGVHLDRPGPGVGGRVGSVLDRGRDLDAPFMEEVWDRHTREGADFRELGEIEATSGTMGEGGSAEMALTAADDGETIRTQALVRLDSVEDHCLTARRRLSTLEAALWGLHVVDEGNGTDGGSSGSANGSPSGTPDDADDEVDRLVFSRPTVADHCASIAGSTFKPLHRTLARLLAVAPERAPTLPKERRDAILADMGNLHGLLMGDLAGITHGLTEDPEARQDRVPDVQRAKRRIDQLLARADELRNALLGRTTTMKLIHERDAPKPTTASADDVPAIDELVDIQDQLVAMVADRIQLPKAWLEQARRDPLDEVMAAPSFPRPMSEPLRDLSPEYLCPGVGDIPKDTVGLLETNQPFIEAYMASLSHEMARELLWRRYPTDRRGTFFRHFWDRRGATPPGEDPQEDIESIHTWDDNALGENAPGADEAWIVLIVRGQLLQRYPNTRIYAAKAIREQRGSEGSYDRVPLLERRYEDIRSGAEDPPATYTWDQLESFDPRDPVFRGKLTEDVTFFGFKLTDTEARSQPVDGGTDALEQGWFFVFEEPPGEPKFGLDMAAEEDYGNVPAGVRPGRGNPTPLTPDELEQGVEKGWDGLSWGHLVPSAEALADKTHIVVAGDRPGDGTPWSVDADDAWYEETLEDGTVSERTFTPRDAATWGQNSAHMARITWQRPVRVAVHADDMLPPRDDGGGAHGE